GYAQVHRRELPDGVRFPPGGVPLPCDGASELWLDGEARWDALRRSPAYESAVAADEAEFIDGAAVLEVRMVDHPVLDRHPLTARDRLVKQFNLIKRRQGLSLADFRHHYRFVFTRTSVLPPCQRNYWQGLLTDASYRDGEPPGDGCSQIWFEDL